VDVWLAEFGGKTGDVVRGRGFRYGEVAVGGGDDDTGAPFGY
jgi:hypothetical protein